MVNLFVQTIRIFARFSIQTIRTLNFIFISALHIIVATVHTNMHIITQLDA